MSESSGDGETTDEIMFATYRALFQHGYSATTISSIADEFDKSRSLICYHYEDKAELPGDFLKYLLDELGSDLAASDGENPKSHLLEIVDLLLPGDLEVAEFVYSISYGAMERRVTVDDQEVLHDHRASIESHLETTLFKYREEVKYRTGLWDGVS